MYTKFTILDIEHHFTYGVLNYHLNTLNFRDIMSLIVDNTEFNFKFELQTALERHFISSRPQMGHPIQSVKFDGTCSLTYLIKLNYFLK